MLLPNLRSARPQAWAAPLPGEIFEQPELLATLTKLVDAEREALKAGKNRKQAILAAYDRFYRGDIARELVAATQAAGGLITMEDLDRWQVYVEDPAVTNYKGIDVYKLNHWVQGPVMLQTLNLLENVDLQIDGLQQRALHSHALSSDELGVRRSRFLLRRSVRAARRADQGPAVEGVRTRAFRARSIGSRTIRSCAPAIRIRSKARRIPIASCSTTGGRASRSAARARERG